MGFFEKSPINKDHFQRYERDENDLWNILEMLCTAGETGASAQIHKYLGFPDVHAVRFESTLTAAALEFRVWRGNLFSDGCRFAVIVKSRSEQVVACGALELSGDPRPITPGSEGSRCDASSDR